jgi:hypothetical protein
VSADTELKQRCKKIADRHVPDQPEAEDTPYTARIRKHQLELRSIARAALKGPTT